MNRPHVLAAAVLLIAACGNPLIAACGNPPGASASAAPPTAPVSAQPTAAPSPAASSTPVATACRLPVASPDAPVDGFPSHGRAGHGGWLTLPGGGFTTDPASLGTYDRQAGKWLPVARAWVSPDGRKYAYPEYPTAGGPATGLIHVVDAATGADHSFPVPAPSMPVSYELEGVYVARVIPSSDAPPQGLSLLDPATGVLKPIVSQGTWTAIGGGAAFGADVDPGLAPPPSAGPGAGNRVRRLDLASGAVSTLYSYSGGTVQVLGVRNGNPVVGVLAAGKFQVLDPSIRFEGTPGAPLPLSPMVSDGDLLWFSGDGAVWEALPAAIAKRISVPLQLAQVAGACR